MGNLSKIKIAKFGGTSMKDASAMRRSAQIIKDHHTQFTVVSATSGTTNQLEDLMELSLNGDIKLLDKKINALDDKHRAILRDLELGEIEEAQIKSITSELKTLIKGVHYLHELTPKAKDRIYSIGERFSSVLFCGHLKKLIGVDTVELIDARDFLVTDSTFNKAKPLPNDIKVRCQILRDSLMQNANQFYVSQGFIGKTIDGETTTLGRGGSDYSASIFGEALNANEIQIWTDVAGIATTDPRVCPEAKIIPEITFKEAAEMAIFGAKILHPTTLTPAKRASIPVFVGSSYQPDAPGTWIKEKSEFKPLVRGITKKDKQGLITVSNPLMANAHGFLADIFNLFEQYDVSVDAITTSEISVAMTVDMPILENKEFISKLETLGKIKIERDYTLVSIIGNKINTTSGIANKIFKGLGETNVRMICQGASVHNFCVLVDNICGEDAVRCLHAQFIN